MCFLSPAQGPLLVSSVSRPRFCAASRPGEPRALGAEGSGFESRRCHWRGHACPLLTSATATAVSTPESRERAGSVHTPAAPHRTCLRAQSLPRPSPEVSRAFSSRNPGSSAWSQPQGGEPFGKTQLDDPTLLPFTTNIPHFHQFKHCCTGDLFLLLLSGTMGI